MIPGTFNIRLDKYWDVEQMSMQQRSTNTQKNTESDKENYLISIKLNCYNSKDMKIEGVLKCYMSNSTLKSAIKFFYPAISTFAVQICYTNKFLPYNINIVSNEIGKNEE